ncbi:hypothetical protein ACFSSA_10475 [Luteolibacter algae]|uniref:Uncharacterized protein n=1 Tax=Luteolibacter algae TaxID=454151 RepID=A0ABW5D8I8_9BACT
MAKLKQGNLFEEDLELLELRAREQKLAEAHKQYVKLPAQLAREKKDREATMPPMAEIRERQQLKQFEENVSRGQIENVLRTQRHSLAMMILLLAATLLMLMWAYKIMIS